MSHTFTAYSALGDQLQFRSMTGYEQMGRLFEFRVRLLSTAAGISAKDMLGTDLTVEVDLTTAANGAGTRYLSGQVAAFAMTGLDGDYYAYEALLRPWLWLATRRSDFRIFQNMTVPDIVQQVLAPYGFVIDNKLTNSYRTWDYCVQYGETDFNFISRLLEHEGAYYYFSHQLGSHHLVLADDIGSHSPLPNGPTTIPYYSTSGVAMVSDEDYIDKWKVLEDITSGRYAANDYDFTKPRALLDTYQAQPGGYSQDDWEIYNWPGGYTEITDGENYARVRIEQLEANGETELGQGNARNIAPGYTFNLTNYPDSQYNQEYLIESARYDFHENVERSDGAGGTGTSATASTDTPTTYRIGFTTILANVRYRVLPHTQKPRTHGPQTAVVVGPAGEEIYTDEYGRIKVQFQWDRYGTNDENSSCWIRVSQTWAGANYGTMHIPRIGQEVIVDFLNGDPDFPIITGRVYNAMQMPPWDLPANKTQSGIKTHSSLGGTPGDGMYNSPGMANALRFEDLAGAEQLWMHAQKDQLIEVENDEVKWVGNDRTKTIDGNETVTVLKNRTETVDLNESITIGLNQQIVVGVNRIRLVGCNEIVGIGNVQGLLVGLDRIKGVGLLEADLIGLAWLDLVGLLRGEIVGLVGLEVEAGFKVHDVGIAMITDPLIQIESTELVRMINVGGAQMTNIGGAQMTDVGAGQLNFIGAVQLTAIGAAGLVLCGDLYAILADKFLAYGSDLAGMISDSALLLQCGDSMIAMLPDAMIISSPAIIIN
jgi:type VI secretion system secreted protein VgrG